jgi:predicted RNase H-like nuclease (RuvC/YqgF family)
MLIGPSITLAELEEHMNDRSYELKMELPKLQKEFNRLREEFKLIPRTIENEKGETITNPDFLNMPVRMQELETQMKDFAEQQEFMDKKLVELEDIEDRSKGRGNVDKSKDKITLTLNDCLKLGLSLEGK